MLKSGTAQQWIQQKVGVCNYKRIHLTKHTYSLIQFTGYHHDIALQCEKFETKSAIMVRGRDMHSKFANMLCTQGKL